MSKTPERHTLVGWKEIAEYLKCSVATAQRRAREGLPVFRVGGSVRAKTKDLDAWLDGAKDTAAEPRPASEPISSVVVGGDALPSSLLGLGDENPLSRYAIIPLGTDVAEYRRVELLLRSTEEKYRHLLETIPVWIWELDVTGQFIYSNPAITAVLGYDPEDLAGYTPSEFLVAPNDANEFESALATLKRKRKVLRGVRYRFLHHDGTLRWLETDAEPSFDNAVYVGLRGVSRDVTLRVELETQVAESRRYLESVLLGSHEAITTLDLDGKVRIWNRGAAELFGYTPAEAVGKKLNSLIKIPPPGRSLHELIAEVSYNDGWLTAEEIIAENKAGESKPLTITYTAIKDGEGIVKGLSVICRDITERKRYEKALLRAASEWRDTFDAVPDLIFLLDDENNILRLNKSAAEAYDRHPAELVGKKCYRVIHGADAPIGNCPHRRLLETGEETTTGVYDKARHRFYEVTCTKLPGAAGASAVVHVMRDVTARELKHRAMRRSEEMYRTLVDTVPGGVFTCDLDGRITFVSAKAVETVGLSSPEEALGKYPWDFVLPAHRDRVLSEFAKLLKEGYADGRGYAVMKPVGTEVILSVNSSIQRNPAGEPETAIFTIYDDTARYEMEYALQTGRDIAYALSAAATLEEAFDICARTAVHAAAVDGAGILISDKTTGAVALAHYHGAFEFFGYAEDATARDAALKELAAYGEPRFGVHPPFGPRQDHPSAPETTAAVLPIRYGSDVIANLIVIAAGDSEINAEARATLQMIAATVGVSIARIRAQEEYQASDRRYRALVEAAGDAIFLLDRNGNFVSANAEAAQAVGTTPQRLLGKNVADIFPPAATPGRLERIRAVFDDNAPLSVSSDLMRTPDGLRWYDTKVVPVRGADGRAQYVLGIARDVTDRLRALEAVKESEGKYRILFETEADALFIVDIESLAILDANVAAEHMYGYGRMEILNSNFEDLVVESAFARQQLSDAAEGLAYAQGYRFHRRKDNTLFPVEIYASVLTLHNRAVTCAAVRDVTDRDKYEEELRVSRDDLRRRVREATRELLAANERLTKEIEARRLAEKEALAARLQIESVLAATQTGLDIIDGDYNIHFINDEWKKIYGDVAGRKCYNYFMGRDEPCERCAAARAIETKLPVIETETLPFENGRRITVLSIPFVNAEGKWMVAEVNVSLPDGS